MLRSLSVLALFLIFFFGCKKSDQISSPVVPGEHGAVSLVFDKTSIPTSVFTISATLKRANYDSIHSVMNVISDSSAELYLPSVATGTWQLVVRAFGDNNQLLFFGEANVNVVANSNVQVNLILQPVGGNVGSIYILVRWGNGNSNNGTWIDFGANPVLSSSNSIFDLYGVAQSKIIYDNNKYRMYYIGVVASARKYVMYAESENGINWVKRAEPILSPGSDSSWDALAVHPGPILKENGVYKMYYNGFASTYGSWGIGLAISNDGINWTKNPSPIMTGTFPNDQLVAWSIIKIEGLYYMYYSSLGTAQKTIWLAVSIDGMNWQTHGNAPILTPTSSWEGSGVSCPSVVKDENIYKMVYMNTTTGITAFGMATSSDGINWTKNSNPFFTEQKTANNWANTDIAYPQLVKINEQWRVYYSGFPIGVNNIYKIGFTRKFE